MKMDGVEGGGAYAQSPPDLKLQSTAAFLQQFPSRFFTHCLSAGQQPMLMLCVVPFLPRCFHFFH